MSKAYLISIALAIFFGSTHTIVLAKDQKSDQETQIEKDFYNYMKDGKQPPSSKVYHTPEASGDISTAAEVNVPEPATLALIGLGLAGLGVLRRKS